MISESRLNSVVLPVTPGSQCVRVAQALDTPLRVMVQVSGPAGALAFLAFDSSALNPVSNNFVSSGFQISAGSEPKVFMIAPRQILYIVGNLAGMSAAIAESDSVPIEEGDAEAAALAAAELRPYQASGPIPKPGDILRFPLEKISELRIQAQGNPFELSFNKTDWVIVYPGPMQELGNFPIMGLQMYLRAHKNAPARYALLGRVGGAP